MLGRVVAVLPVCDMDATLLGLPIICVVLLLLYVFFIIIILSNFFVPGNLRTRPTDASETLSKDRSYNYTCKGCADMLFGGD